LTNWNSRQVGKGLFFCQTLVKVFISKMNPILIPNRQTREPGFIEVVAGAAGGAVWCQDNAARRNDVDPAPRTHAAGTTIEIHPKDNLIRY